MNNILEGFLIMLFEILIAINKNSIIEKGELHYEKETSA
jgi:hypothetical protein